VQSDIFWQQTADGTASPGGEATTLYGGTEIAGGGTPNTGCEMPFRLNLISMH